MQDSPESHTKGMLLIIQRGQTFAFHHFYLFCYFETAKHGNKSKLKISNLK